LAIYNSVDFKSIAPSAIPEPGIYNVIIDGSEGIGKTDFPFHVKTGLEFL
jgi:hypothetical protein